MEEEISLKEIFITLWQGRYIIITVTAVFAIVAALASIFFVTPLYRTSALIDASLYQNGVECVAGHLEADRVVSDTLRELRNEGAAIESADVSEAGDGRYNIEVSAPSPQVAAEAADHLGLTLLRWLKKHELEKMYADKERIEGTLEIIKFQFHELESYQQDLIARRASLESALSQLDQFVIERFGQLSAGEEVVAMEINPAYQAIKEKEGQLLTELFEIEHSIARLEGGDLVGADILSETEYEGISTRKEDLRYELAEVSYMITRYENDIAHQVPDQFLYPADTPTQPYNIRWQLNTAVAFVLGLMLSVMVVFVKPYIGEIVKEIRETKNDPEK